MLLTKRKHIPSHDDDDGEDDDVDDEEEEEDEENDDDLLSDNVRKITGALKLEYPYKFTAITVNEYSVLPSSPPIT